MTFKLPDDEPLDEGAELRCVFARTHGLSLGKVQGDTAQRLATELWQLAGDQTFDHLHVWQRDAAIPGDDGFEPGLTALAEEVGRVIAEQMPAGPARAGPPPLNRVAKSGHRILDCMLVEPDQWWIGYHRASTMPSRWPGGVPKIELPAEAVSRTYLKTAEALLWSRLPVEPGDRCVEIGSAPGGSCQALLERGLRVIGIDPAEMDPAVLEHPNFTHIRARTAALKRSEFRGVRWLTVDSNVAPAHTLDAVEDIVTNGQVHVRGMLLTLKMPDWESGGGDSRIPRARPFLGLSLRECPPIGLRPAGNLRRGAAEPRVAPPAGQGPASAASRAAPPTDGSGFGTMNARSRRMRLTCTACAACSTCGPAEMLQHLRSLGMLRREKEPDPDLVAELFRTAAGRWPVPPAAEPDCRSRRRTTTWMTKLGAEAAAVNPAAGRSRPNASGRCPASRCAWRASKHGNPA